MNTFHICYEAPNEKVWKTEIDAFAKQRERHLNSLALPLSWMDTQLVCTEWPDDPTVCLLKSSDESLEDARKHINSETINRFEDLIKKFGKEAINKGTVFLKIYQKGQMKEKK